MGYGLQGTAPFHGRRCRIDGQLDENSKLAYGGLFVYA